MGERPLAYAETIGSIRRGSYMSENVAMCNRGLRFRGESPAAFSESSAATPANPWPDNMATTIANPSRLRGLR
eukprot:CAMPEP_0183417134 /NCGR_PEP_ID=MMETSP0370-20130417/24228_1 /TAXON_ID=268820 /ORGANISM="Peridinium aciculiferum, Strain PAER-2" /LENGTH=72 /DNA_ID=CAMNT_0025600693 /DNA_START=97 /DNA_END=312 /DNA_ORIENTATION=+